MNYYVVRGRRRYNVMWLKYKSEEKEKDKFSRGSRAMNE